MRTSNKTRLAKAAEINADFQPIKSLYLGNGRRQLQWKTIYNRKLHINVRLSMTLNDLERAERTTLSYIDFSRKCLPL